MPKSTNPSPAYLILEAIRRERGLCIRDFAPLLGLTNPKSYNDYAQRPIGLSIKILAGLIARDAGVVEEIRAVLDELGGGE